METRNERQSAEFSAKNVEQAIEKGLSALGISREEAEISVIKQGSRGVLGIGAEDAVVRITVPEPPAELEESERPEAPAVPDADTPAPVQEEPPAPVAPEPTQGAPEDRIAAIAKEVVENLLTKMGIKARVEEAEDISGMASDGEEVIALNVTGDDLGVLIGRRGETLRDLQFITRLVVSRQVQRWPNIVVDVEYYKARREKLLMDLAKRMSERVRLNGTPIALEPMPAHERRIVHISLRGDPDVYTESTGEGQSRKVVIIAK